MLKRQEKGSQAGKMAHTFNLSIWKLTTEQFQDSQGCPEKPWLGCGVGGSESGIHCLGILPWKSSAESEKQLWPKSRTPGWRERRRGLLGTCSAKQAIFKLCLPLSPE